MFRVTRLAGVARFPIGGDQRRKRRRGEHSCRIPRRRHGIRATLTNGAKSVRWRLAAHVGRQQVVETVLAGVVLDFRFQIAKLGLPAGNEAFKFGHDASRAGLVGKHLAQVVEVKQMRGIPHA